MIAALTPYVFVLASLGAGILLGIAYFATLARTVRHFSEGRAVRAAGLQLARFAVLGGTLYAMVRLGALPLLAGGAGILIGRHLVMRRSRVDDGEAQS